MSRSLRHPFKAAVNCLDNKKRQLLLQLTGGIQAGEQIYDFAGRRPLNASSSRGSEHLQSHTFGCSLYSYFNLLKSRNLGLCCGRNSSSFYIALASGLLRGTAGRVTVGEGPGTSMEFTAPCSYPPLCLTLLLPGLSFPAQGLCRVRSCTSGHWHKRRTCPAQK